MIKIICVGKLKEKYLTDAINEYRKRLTKYTKLEIIEVASSNGDNIDINLVNEMNNIKKYINQKDYVIILDIIGKQLTSLELSNYLDNQLMLNPNIVFIIGGSNGIHEDIKRESNYSISFSSLTFPHQLFRVLLLEQIYRSFKIINNESYHK